jgi:hypothetical protein
MLLLLWLLAWAEPTLRQLKELGRRQYRIYTLQRFVLYQLATLPLLLAGLSLTAAWLAACSGSRSRWCCRSRLRCSTPGCCWWRSCDRLYDAADTPTWRLEHSSRGTRTC